MTRKESVQAILAQVADTKEKYPLQGLQFCSDLVSDLMSDFLEKVLREHLSQHELPAAFQLLSNAAGENLVVHLADRISCDIMHDRDNTQNLLDLISSQLVAGDLFTMFLYYIDEQSEDDGWPENLKDHAVNAIYNHFNC